MPKFKTLKQINLKNKRALLRVDLNIPLGENMKVDENEKWRIEAIIPTLKYLIKQKAKIILISHLGRPASTPASTQNRGEQRGEPKGKRDKKLSLKPIANELRKILKKKIIFSEEIIGWKVEKKIESMKLGQI